MYDRILGPTDGSRTARAAIRTALDLAARAEADVPVQVVPSVDDE